MITFEQPYNVVSVKLDHIYDLCSHRSMKLKQAVGEVKQERIYTKVAFLKKGFSSKECRPCRPGIPAPGSAAECSLLNPTAHESATGSLTAWHTPVEQFLSLCCSEVCEDELLIASAKNQ
jgi:hypothetical protein